MDRYYDSQFEDHVTEADSYVSYMESLIEPFGEIYDCDDTCVTVIIQNKYDDVIDSVKINKLMEKTDLFNGNWSIHRSNNNLILSLDLVQPPESGDPDWLNEQRVSYG